MTKELAKGCAYFRSKLQTSDNLENVNVPITLTQSARQNNYVDTFDLIDIVDKLNEHFKGILVKASKFTRTVYFYDTKETPTDIGTLFRVLSELSGFTVSLVAPTSVTEQISNALHYVEESALEVEALSFQQWVHAKLVYLPTEYVDFWSNKKWEGWGDMKETPGVIVIETPEQTGLIFTCNFTQENKLKIIEALLGEDYDTNRQKEVANLPDEVTIVCSEEDKGHIKYVCAHYDRFFDFIEVDGEYRAIIPKKGSEACIAALLNENVKIC